VKRWFCAHGRARALMLAGALGLGVLATDAAAAEVAEGVDACVTFRSESVEKQLVVHASNACERRLSCSLDYTLSCEDVNGKQTSRADKRLPFTLGKQGSRELSLSADACQQGWRIDGVRWDCS
jgi:hypothetical protein